MAGRHLYMNVKRGYGAPVTLGSDPRLIYLFEHFPFKGCDIIVGLRCPGRAISASLDKSADISKFPPIPTPTVMEDTG